MTRRLNAHQLARCCLAVFGFGEQRAHKPHAHHYVYTNGLHRWSRAPAAAPTWRTRSPAGSHMLSRHVARMRHKRLAHTRSS